MLAADGRKLSKQNGATPLDLADDAAAVRAMQAAGTVLGLPALHATTPADWLAQAVPAWAAVVGLASSRPFPTQTEPP